MTDGMNFEDWDDMLVETPVPEAELRRTPKPGHEGENQCTYCLRVGVPKWYPVEDVMVVRHWKTTSQDVRGGGHWTWYCPEHFDKRRGRWWRYSHLAPARLLPEEKHYCVRDVGLGARCGIRAVEPFDGQWFCEPHAAAERVNRRAQELFAGEPPEDPLDE